MAPVQPVLALWLWYASWCGRHRILYTAVSRARDGGQDGPLGSLA